MSISIDELRNMDFSDVADGNIDPVHPGEILLYDFLQPLKISQYRLAKEIGVQQRRISEIVKGKRSVTPDTGLRLSRFFGLNDNFWIGLQADYDMVITKKKLSDTLNKIKPVVNG